MLLRSCNERCRIGESVHQPRRRLETLTLHHAMIEGCEVPSQLHYLRVSVVTHWWCVDVMPSLIHPSHCARYTRLLSRFFVEHQRASAASLSFQRPPSALPFATSAVLTTRRPTSPPSRQRRKTDPRHSGRRTNKRLTQPDTKDKNQQKDKSRHRIRSSPGPIQRKFPYLSVAYGVVAGCVCV